MHVLFVGMALIDFINNKYSSVILSVAPFSHRVRLSRIELRYKIR